jgi:tRNA(fMet)-specific endonuclease VapC
LKKLKGNGRLAVDTNAVIAYREGISEVCTLVNEMDIIFLPVTVLGELLYGAFNSAKPQNNEQAVRKFLAHSVIIPIDDAIATRYAVVRLNLKKAGCPIPENDIWVAATCLELNVPLISSDSHFNNIKGLEGINWENKG